MIGPGFAAGAAIILDGPIILIGAIVMIVAGFLMGWMVWG